MQKFKDKCDICGEFNYLKGFNNKCLCPKCLIKEIKNDNKRKENKNE